ncbi:MAG TPA: hypothetical protein VE621_16840 [Bryobacteraceae bacterium]|nr:hypothetical protein [Bryobacteraceae bacterium]
MASRCPGIPVGCRIKHERIPMMHPDCTALEMGIPVAGNSDFGVCIRRVAVHPDMVTRKSAWRSECYDLMRLVLW